MLMIFALLLTSFFTWLADTLYYSNRNVTYWVHTDIAITTALLLLSAIIQTCLLRKPRQRGVNSPPSRESS